jgi:hypothetical protein
MTWFRRDTLSPQELKKIEDWEDRQLSRAADSLKGALLFSGSYAGMKGESAKPARAATPAPDKGAAPAAVN